MSIESMGWALNLSEPPLTPAEKLVLIGICNHDGDGGAWPSMATLARYAGLSERQARRCIESLEAVGLVERKVNEGGTHNTPGGTRPNLYVVHRAVADVRPREDVDVRPGRSPASAEPSLNHPTPPIAPQGGRRKIPRIVTELEPDERPEDFDRFWALYPRKDSKNDARKAWLQVLDTIPPMEELEPAVLAIEPRISRLHPTTPEWRKFIKYPAAWLRAAGWEDERPAPVATPAEIARNCAVCGLSPIGDASGCLMAIKGLGDPDEACPWRKQ